MTLYVRKWDIMASETINVGKKMRSEAWIQKSKRKKKHFRVSPQAVQEMMSYILTGIEVNIPSICRSVEDTNHPNTIQVVDIIQFFNNPNHTVFKKMRDDSDGD